MPYQDSFLNKCNTLVEQRRSGAVNHQQFCARLNELFALHSKNADYLLETIEEPDAVEHCERANELCLSGLQAWEEGFNCLLDFAQSPKVDLLDEALDHFKMGNDILNNAKERYLDVGEEDEVKFTL